MNYLAHLALAFPHSGLIIGNFIGDHIRNKELVRYKKTIQRGVLMHREIDLFTDRHKQTIALRKLLFPEYRHFSRVLVDIYYDHFLALHFHKFYQQGLAAFVVEVEAVLTKHKDELPNSAQSYLNGMITQGWLLMYAEISGVDDILQMMSRRTKYSILSSGINGLTDHYKQIEAGFLRFYPELIAYCSRIKKNS
jgi:acyl carrier protein phosphodiesterase